MGHKQNEIMVVDNVIQALELRKEGTSYRNIAKALGVSTATAFNYVQKGLKLVISEPAEELRQMELERIDTLWQGLWDHRTQPEVVDRLVKLMDMRAKLTGLYAPTKIAPTDPTGTKPFELSPEERLRRIRALMKVNGEVEETAIEFMFGNDGPDNTGADAP